MCLSILSCSHFCFINDILVKFKEIGKKGGEITNFTLFGLCQNQRQSSSKAPAYSRVKDMFHHKTSAQILMQSGKKKLMPLTAAHHQASGMLLNGVPG